MIIFGGNDWIQGDARVRQRYWLGTIRHHLMHNKHLKYIVHIM